MRQTPREKDDDSATLELSHGGDNVTVIPPHESPATLMGSSAIRKFTSGSLEIVQPQEIPWEDRVVCPLNRCRPFLRRFEYNMFIVNELDFSTAGAETFRSALRSTRTHTIRHRFPENAQPRSARP